MGKGTKYSEEYKQIGRNIGEYRRKKKISQEKLAEKVGISFSYISQIEAPNVVKKMSIEVLYDIANALGVKIEDLLKKTD